ncbi:type I restriction-modification system [Canicola haemoglobinophilus]|uniref:Type I restriction-modification system n=1 Tax=Canicola haemoglobinophilus TaxID=733 RepID=A0AB38H7J0_9PAST|nr:restriction endonuclease subunit S [Canicola haemoglobinophilus]STO54668.1 type I restriction-modification system [Canicola haemoglobinophilus]STO67557.1 type I restriction-modification system [Canicola haemoglobinophilus]
MKTNILKMIEQAEVEWKPLGEVAEIYGGLTGKTKNDFENGNAKYLTYKNIFGNIEVEPNNLETVKVSDNERQHQVKYGDILFTGSSEIAEEAGMSSSVTTRFDEPIYLNSFSFGVRFNQNIEITPEFSKYLFRSHYMRKQIIKTASGVTRFNISKEKFKKILIPIPPLELQKEIVKRLDILTELEAALEAALEAELSLRKKQYQYYRDLLLTFDDISDRGGYKTNPFFSKDVVWKSLGEVGELIRGNGLTKKDLLDDGVPAIHYGQIYTHFGTFADKTKSFTSPEIAKKLRKAQYGDVLIAGTSENVQDVMKPVGWFGDEIVFSGDMFAFRPNEKIMTKYLTYMLQTTAFAKFKEKHAQGTKVIRISSANFLNYQIPIPLLETQAKIVAILDKFDRLTSSITDGLPKEIELRRKQYEYYRELLLGFGM